jgi:hypothetical protein
MNIDDTVWAVTEKGFTERQARFLVFVARHSGVCVMRQYSSETQRGSQIQEPISSELRNRHPQSRLHSGSS